MWYIIDYENARTRLTAVVWDSSKESAAEKFKNFLDSDLLEEYREEDRAALLAQDETLGPDQIDALSEFFMKDSSFSEKGEEISGEVEKNGEVFILFSKSREYL